MTRHRVRAAGAITAAITATFTAAVLLVAACGGPDTRRPSGTLTDGGVRVTAVLTGAARIAVTFTPERPGFHLYSLDLPVGGIDGLGIPTVVRVRAGTVPTGPASADRPVRKLRVDPLNVELPVYPDGPVTVSLPVRPTTSKRVEVLVTYGACSVSSCLPPVQDRLIVLG